MSPYLKKLTDAKNFLNGKFRCPDYAIVLGSGLGGVLDGLGLGYEAIAAENPAVGYVSSQGYGRGGPLGQMPAYGTLNAARSNAVRSSSARATRSSRRR